MEYAILNNGCSFSARTKVTHRVSSSGREKPSRGWKSYCDFLPKKCWNTASAGSGIETGRIKNVISGKRRPWLESSKTKECFLKVELTHFIYQIPSPTRQPLFLELSEKEFFQATMRIDDPYYLHLIQKDIQPSREVKTQYLKREFLLTQLKNKNKNEVYLQSHLIANNINIFDRRDRYLKKALNEVQKHVNIVRERWPNVKIIFLRYEETRIPLVYEFCKDWYKTALSDYCNDNNITYIYEKNFCTKWFWRNGLTIDKGHPNEDGAKLIADKIIEYL